MGDALFFFIGAIIVFIASFYIDSPYLSDYIALWKMSGILVVFSLINLLIDNMSPATPSVPNPSSPVMPIFKTVVLCPNCNHRAPIEMKFCPECGASLAHKNERD